MGWNGSDPDFYGNMEDLSMYPETASVTLVSGMVSLYMLTLLVLMINNVKCDGQKYNNKKSDGHSVQHLISEPSITIVYQLNSVQFIHRICQGWVRGSHNICPSRWADFCQY